MKKALYWVGTGLLAFAMLGGGIGMVSGAQAETLAHLGYPAYFALLLGAWKLLAVPALLVPGLQRLKQFAYAGIFFNLTSAALSHLWSGDGVVGALPPLVVLGFWGLSYFLHEDVRFGAESPVARALTGSPAVA